MRRPSANRSCRVVCHSGHCREVQPGVLDWQQHKDSQRKEAASCVMLQSPTPAHTFQRGGWRRRSHYGPEISLYASSGVDGGISGVRHYGSGLVVSAAGRSHSDWMHTRNRPNDLVSALEISCSAFTDPAGVSGPAQTCICLVSLSQVARQPHLQLEACAIC